MSIALAPKPRWSVHLLPNPAALFCQRFFGNPVFVVGAGRSGTTVLCRALGTHPQVLDGPYEAAICHEIGTLAYRFSNDPTADWYRTATQLPKEQISQRLRRLLFEAVWGGHYGFRSFLRIWSRRQRHMLSKRFWLTKGTPDEQAALGLISLYPNTKFLYIHRNGIDNVASQQKFFPFSEKPFSWQCKFWASRVDRYRYLADNERALRIAYEDLITARQETFDRILAFLSLRESKAPARFAEKTIVHPIDRQTRKGVDVTDVFNRRNPAYHGWSKEQRKLFKEICSDGMNELGYEIPF